MEKFKGGHTIGGHCGCGSIGLHSGQHWEGDGESASPFLHDILEQTTARQSRGTSVGCTHEPQQEPNGITNVNPGLQLRSFREHSALEQSRFRLAKSGEDETSGAFS